MPRSDEDSASDTVRNTVWIDADGALQWNGAAIDSGRLRQYLALTAQMTPTPRFDLEVDPLAPCNEVGEVVAIASSLLECAQDCSYQERSR